MIPLSTLVDVLREYRTEGFDENSNVLYEEHMLAAYIITVSFAKMQGEQLPQPTILLAATTVIQSWLGQDSERWCTNYKSHDMFTTELMGGKRGEEMVATGDGATLAESIIKAATGLKL